MSDFEASLVAIIGGGMIATLIVMLVNKPVEKNRETFDKRDW